MPCRFTRLVLIFCLPLGLSACAEFPVLDAAVSPDATRAPFPQILPLDALLVQAAVAQTGPLTGTALEARAEALRRKAAALRAAP